MKFCNELTPDMRIQIPGDLRAFLRLKPGDKIELQYQGFDTKLETMTWRALVDERFQVCIPDDVIRVHSIKPKHRIALWHDNPDRIYVKPQVNWEDKPANPDGVLSSFTYGRVTVELICKTPEPNTKRYMAKLSGIENVSWEKAIVPDQNADAEVDIDQLKASAISCMILNGNSETQRIRNELENVQRTLDILVALKRP